MSKRRTHAYLLILSSTAIWGLAGPVVKFTLNGLDPFTFLTYRFAISTVISIAYFSYKKPKLPKSPKDISLVLIFGLLATTFALGFGFSGLDRTTVLDQGIISLLGPLMVVIGGAILLKDHITKREKIGISIAFLGTAITAFEPLLASNGDGIKFSGNILLILGVTSDVTAFLIAKKLTSRKISPVVLTNISFIIGFLTIGAVTSYTTSPQIVITKIINLPLKYHLGVFYMALLSGSLAYYLRILGQKTIEISEAALFIYLQPLFSAPLAVIWLGEKITPIYVVGASILLVGVAFAEYKTTRRAKSRYT